MRGSKGKRDESGKGEKLWREHIINNSGVDLY